MSHANDAACKMNRTEITKSTGAKGYVCPGTFWSTGANDPLPLWVRRLWWQLSDRKDVAPYFEYIAF